MKKERAKTIATTAKQQAIANYVVLDPKAREKTKTSILTNFGYAISTAKTAQKEIFSAEGMQNALRTLGVTPEKLLAVGTEAMQAKKGTFYEGEYHETNAPDHEVRLKGGNFIADMFGLKKQVIEQRNVNINVAPEDIAHLF